MEMQAARRCNVAEKSTDFFRDSTEFARVRLANVDQRSSRTARRFSRYHRRRSNRIKVAGLEGTVMLDHRG